MKKIQYDAFERFDIQLNIEINFLISLILIQYESFFIQHIIYFNFHTQQLTHHKINSYLE